MKTCLLVLGLIAATATAQPPQPDPGPQPVRRMMRPPPPAMTGARADLAVELIAGMPTILATVNGRGPYRFGVDTGAAGYLRVSPALAQALELRQVGEAMAGDPSGRNPIRIPVYRVESLAFGGLTFSGISTTALPQLGPRTAQVDGVIGIGFFENLLLTIDYGRLRLSAGPGALPPANGRDVVEATLDRSLISVPLRIGETTQLVHLDTGNAAQPLFLPAEAVAALPTEGEPRIVGRARTVSQEIEIRSLGLTVPVSVGTTRLPVTAVGYPAAAPPGNIGSLALTGMALTVDYANRRVRIVPSRP
ncbi:MAG TPA: aspartyl protease family protein [Allosphingosinicella sp.]|nr:aspartyl protease family protein [Allosphingosinicella sp.]